MRIFFRQAMNTQGLDKILAFAVLFLSTALVVVLYLIRLYQPIGLGITIQVASLSYLVTRGSLGNSVIDGQQETRVVTSSILRIDRSLLSILLTAATTLFVIYVSVDSTSRPAWVFIITALLFGIISTQIFQDQIDETHNIVQLLILATTITVMSITTFPYSGGDTWAHLHNARVIQASNTIQSIQGAYRDYPLYPTTLAILSSAANIDTGTLSRILNVIITISCSMLLYSLSRKFYSTRQSAILVLLLLGSKWFIYWSTLVVSMAIAMLLYCLLIAILFRRLHKRPDAKDALALILVSGAIPFFHPAGAVATVLLLVGFWTVETMFGNRDMTRNSLISMVIFVIVVTLVQWMYFGEFIFDSAVQNLARAIFTDSGSLSGPVASYRDPIVFTLDQLNFYFLIGTAEFGILHRIKLKHADLQLYAGIIGLMFVILGYSTQIIGFQEALPYRWLLFGTLLLIFPASSVFMKLSQHRSKYIRVVATCLIFIYSITGITNTETNRDHPFYGESITELFELTSPEYDGLVVLSDIVSNKDKQAIVDFRLWDYLKYTSSSEKIKYWREMRLESFDGIFPTRLIYYERPFFTRNPDFNVYRTEPNNSQFYDSGDMQLIDCVNASGTEK